MKAEETLRAFDKTGIFMRSWIPARVAQSVVVICHGQADHSGRFDHVGTYLADCGHAVYGYDHRGQGRSCGPRGHVDRFTDFYDDLAVVVNTIKERHPGLRAFVVGHSLGSLIALGYAQRNPGAISGLVAGSPCLALKMHVPAAKKAIAKGLAWIMPHLAMDTGLPAEHLAHSADVVAAYKADPMRAPKVTTRFYIELTGAMADITAHPEALTVPVLFMAGGDDLICSTPVTAAFYEKVSSTDKKLIVWDGMYHEILNEPDNSKVLEVMEQWISERRKA